ncbi:MAG: fluoride efflux transporter CrcB [Phycisphaerales bacterium]
MTETPSTLLRSVLVFIGAGTGGLLRYGVGLAFARWLGAGFPFGTLFINVSGCLVMGFLTVMWLGATPIREELRLLVLVGVLGGYTTFSTFGHETLKLTANGEWMRASLYVAASMALSLMAVFAGAALAQRAAGTTA